MSSAVEVADKNKLRKEYDELVPLYRRLIEEVCFLLKENINEKKIKISIDSRLKTFDSLYDKIVTKEMSKVSLNDMADIAGVRIVCLLRSDLEIIGKKISQNFKVLHADTIRSRSPTQFGYMSDHYVVKLPDSFVGARYDQIKPLKCEIQVRTILMDAWASVSHHLDYKKEIDIPLELRKDFNAVSGLLYAADTHFELFREGVEKARKALLTSVKKEEFNLDQEINLDSLDAYLKMKYPERQRTRDSYSELIKELRAANYIKIKELDKALKRSKTAFENYEKEEHREKHFTDVGVVRISLGISDRVFRKMKYKQLTHVMSRYEHLLET